MTITILSENGRGRHLCQWAVAQGFQVNMVLPEQDAYLEFPFGEFIVDENTDWAQDFIEEAQATKDRWIEKNKTLVEMTAMGTKNLDASYAKALSASWFDLDKAIRATGEAADFWWTRQWQQEDWLKRVQKLKNQGVNFDPVDRQLYGIAFDFRNDFQQKPIWQWGSFKIEWDPALYEDVMPPSFVWLKNKEEYLAYENFSFVRKDSAEKIWEVFVKLPYSRQAETYPENFVTIMRAWIRDFKVRLRWAKVEPLGQFKVFPFYQWRNPKQNLATEKAPYFYDKGPHTFGSWSFKAQWQCEKNIFDVLAESVELKSQRKNQRKKNPYDFQILEA